MRDPNEPDETSAPSAANTPDDRAAALDDADNTADAADAADADAPVASQLPSAISPGRVEAFSDGVLAVIITIMVLELHRPESDKFSELLAHGSEFLIYGLSFVFIGIYWNNHHHLFHATKRVNGAVMWTNLHLLFWLSLIPFATDWSGNHFDAQAPAAVYGFVSLMAGIAYSILVRAILAANKGTAIERAIGGDFKGIVSIVIYAAGTLLALIPTFGPILAYLAYLSVAIIWFIPDRRLVRRA